MAETKTPKPRALADVLKNDMFKHPELGWVPLDAGLYGDQLNQLFENTGYLVIPPPRVKKRKAGHGKAEFKDGVQVWPQSPSTAVPE